MLASWAEQNVDPSLFSRELMANASSFVEDEEVCDFDMHHDGCNVVIIKFKIFELELCELIYLSTCTYLLFWL